MYVFPISSSPEMTHASVKLLSRVEVDLEGLDFIEKGST
jgi:hypothetical protein